jgi:hypothetical protein
MSSPNPVEASTIPYEYLFAHHRVTDSGHPLNEGLEGYCWGSLPWVPQAASYSPKLLNTVGSLQLQMAGEPYTLYQEITPPLQAEEMGLPT